jgi:hypothetical protein
MLLYNSRGEVDGMPKLGGNVTHYSTLAIVKPCKNIIGDGSSSKVGMEVYALDYASLGL